MSDVNANINISINSQQALGQLRALQNQISAFNQSVIAGNVAASTAQRDMTRNLTAQINASKGFTTSIANVETSVSRLGRAIDKNKLSLREYFRYGVASSGAMGKGMREHAAIMELAGERVKRLQTQYIALEQAHNGFTRSMAVRPTNLFNADAAIAIQRQQIFNKLLNDGSTSLVNWGKNTQWAGRQLMVGFTVPLTIFGGIAGKIFMDLEKQVVQFKRVYGDLQTPTSERNAMVEEVKALAKEFTKYGIAVSDTVALAAKAAATGAQGDDLIAATTEATRLATLGQIDYQQALDATISLQTALGISSNDLAKATDFLNAVENQTVTSLDDITQAIPLVAPVIKGLGGDVKDLAIFMTAMREGGISANEGANALKSGLASLINPTRGAKEQLEKVGISIDSILSRNKGDLRGLIMEFGTALGSLNKFERQQTLAKMFGKYQFARMGALFANISKEGSQAARVMDLTAMSAKELGQIAEGELGQLEESVGVKFTAAVEKLKLAIAPIGEAFLKIATPIIDFATKIADAFNNLPDAAKTFITWGTAIGGVLVPTVIMLVGLLGNFAGNMLKIGAAIGRLMGKTSGLSSGLEYLTMEELDAMAAAASLEGQTNSLTGALNVQRSAVNKLASAYGSYTAAAGAAAASLPQGFRGPVRRMATGGFVAGSGNKDSEPALLMPGEFVVNKKAAQRNASLLTAMNDGSLKGYADGSPALPQSRRGAIEYAHIADRVELTMSQIEGLLSAMGSGASKAKTILEKGMSRIQSGQASGVYGYSNLGIPLRGDVNAQMAGAGAPRSEFFSALKSSGAGSAAGIIDVLSQRGVITPEQSKQFGNVFYQEFTKEMQKIPNSVIRDPDMTAPFNTAVKRAADSIGKEFSNTAMEIINKEAASITTIVDKEGQAHGSSGRASIPSKISGVTTSYRSRRGQRRSLFSLLGGTNPAMVSAEQMGMAATQSSARGAGTASPSKITQQQGKDVAKGMEIGIRQGTPAVADAGEDMGRAAVQASGTAAQKGASFNPEGWLAGGKSPYDPRPEREPQSGRVLPNGVVVGGQSRRTLPSGQDIDYRRTQYEVNEATGKKTKEMGDNLDNTNRGLRGFNGKLMGGMMAMDGLLFGMSMMDNGVGEFAQKIMPAAFALQGIGMMLPMLTNPFGIAVAAIAAIGTTAFLLKRGLDANIEAGKKMADSMSVASKEIDGVAEFFGRKTFASRRKEKRDRELSGLTTKQQTMATEFSQSEAGKAMVEEAKIAMAKSGRGFAGTLATQLSQMVISGAVNKKQAEAMALGISQALGKEELTAEIIGKINSIIGPNGEDLTNEPLKIIANIEASMSRDEANLADRAAAQGQWESSWLSSDNFLGMGWAYSGEFDAMIEDAIAYQQTYIANTNSLLSSIDDEVARQQILIDKLKEKKKAAKEANDEEKANDFQKQIATTQATIDRLNEKRQQTLEQRRQQATNIMLNSPRAESFQAAKTGIEEQFGVTGMNEAILMATQRTSENREQSDRLEAAILVDIQLGRVDPVAFTAMEKMGEDSEQVMKLAMEAYVAGDVEDMNSIMQAYTSLPPSVVTVVKPLVDQMGYEKAASFLSIIGMFPPEVATKVAVEISEMDEEEIDKIYKSIKNLQELGIDVAGLLAGEGGVESILKLNEALSGIPKTLKKFAKELNAIDKIKSKDAKIEKTIQVVTKITDAEGNPTTPENIRVQIREVADDADLSVAQVMSLPSDVYTKAILMKLNADALRTQGQALLTAAKSVGSFDATMGKEMASKAMALINAANAIDDSAAAAVQEEYAPPDKPSGNTPSGTSGSGGGGPKANPIKDLKKAIMDRMKLYLNMTSLMKQLKGKKQGFTKQILDSTKYNGSIADQLRDMNLSETLVADILSKGAKDAQKIIKKLGEKGLREQDRKLLAGMRGEQVSGLVGRRVVAQDKVKATRKLSRVEGLSQDQINEIVSDEGVARVIATLKVGSKAWNEYMKNIKATAAAEKEYENISKTSEERISEATEKLTEAHDDLIEKIDEEIEGYQDQIDAINEQIDAIKELNDADQDIIDGLNRQKEIIQRQIDSLERANELDQRKIDSLQRQDELRQRVADALQRELEIMSRTEQEIRETYQKRIDALDRVAQINDHILQTQRSQLDISKALTEGDVYAAAAAAQEMQQQDAQFASEQTRQSLQANMENQIAGLTTASGLTRAQAEAQIQAIQDQSYQTQLQIRDIQDRIYERNLQMIPLKDQQYQLDLSIREVEDRIYERGLQIDALERDIQPLQDRIDAQEKIKDALTDQLEEQVKQLEAAKDNLKAMDEQIAAADALAKQWANVQKMIAEANKTANDSSIETAVDKPKREKYDSDESWREAISKWKADIEKTRQEAIAAAQATVKKYAGGIIKKFGVGSVVGEGSRDSVPAMLTPGEYVIRKAMVDKYGLPMLENINQGSFSMPKYNNFKMQGATVSGNSRAADAKTSSPVYNTSYSINVNARTNASPDEIANVVMNKISNIESMSVRGYRGN